MITECISERLPSCDRFRLEGSNLRSPTVDAVCIERSGKNLWLLLGDSGELAIVTEPTRVLILDTLRQYFIEDEELHA